MGFAKDISEMKQNDDNAISSFDDLIVSYNKCNKCADTIKSGAWMKYIHSPFMAIGANPSCKNDDRFEGRDKKYYFRDKKYEEILNEILRTVGLSVDDVYITNLCKCATKNNEKLSHETIKNCATGFLKYEMSFIKPKIIFAFGAQVCDVFKLNIGGSRNEGGKLFIGVPHPSSLRYDSNKEKFINILNLNREAIIDTYTDWKFNHLHIHNHHSLRDSVIKIPELGNFLNMNHKSHIISTNHYRLSDCLQIEVEANKHNMIPVFGLEIAMMDNIDEFYRALEGDDAKLKTKLRNEKARHLTLIAKNLKGFKNLIKIHNNGWDKGYYRRPYVDYKYILDNLEGIICTSACSAGILSYELLNDNKEAAMHYAAELKEKFGDDFYIELMLIDFEPQIRITKELIEIAEKLNIKTIITGDVHYLNENDYVIREMMYNLYNKNITITEMKEKKDLSCKDLYFKSYYNLREQYDKQYKSEEFSIELFNRSINEVSNVLSKIEKYDIPRANHELSFYDDAYKLIREKLSKSFAQKLKEGNIDKDKAQIYKDRVAHELEVINEMNYVDYFLILEDIISYCKQKHGKYSVGPGRGSASGSLISYLLGITGIDPIKHDLLFERFLSKGREDIVDIDTDFAADIRDDVIEYATKRFGSEHVISIGTASLLKTKTVILDVSRFLGIPAQDAFKITASAMKNLTDEEMTMEQLRSEFVAFDKMILENPEMEIYFDKLRKNIRHYSKHAAGVLITPENLYEKLPLIKVGGELLTGWQEGSDYHELSQLGYYKFDMLGLKGLKMINDTLKQIDDKIDFDDIDLNNKEIIEAMYHDDYVGIFQFESTLARNVIKSVRPECFEDYVHINSLLRPGPLRAGMVDEYAARKNDEKAYTIHDSLKNILSRTYGVIIEQEQIMKIAQQLGGFSDIESNKFRKALVKYSKSAENEQHRFGEILSYKEKFIKNTSDKIGEEQAIKLFELISHFAAYGFNRSHSLSYAMIAYIEMYLKTYYMKEFYVSLLNNVDAAKKDDYFDFALKKYIISVMNHNIELLPPDINKSDDSFKLDGDKIRFGLSHIKYLSEKGILEVKNARPVKSLEDLLEKAQKRILNKRVVESLIYSRAFDGIYNTTAEALSEFARIRKIEIPDDIDFVEKERSVLRVCLSELLHLKEIRKKYKHLGVVGKIAGKIKSTSKNNSTYYKFSIYNDIDKYDNIYVWDKLLIRKFEDIKEGDIVAVATMKKGKFLYLRDLRIIKEESCER